MGLKKGFFPIRRVKREPPEGKKNAGGLPARARAPNVNQTARKAQRMEKMEDIKQRDKESDAATTAMTEYLWNLPITTDQKNELHLLMIEALSCARRQML